MAKFAIHYLDHKVIDLNSNNIKDALRERRKFVEQIIAPNESRLLGNGKTVTFDQCLKAHKLIVIED